MPDPKPITLTQISATAYQGAGEPQPFVVVDKGAAAGEAGLVTTQAAVPNLAAQTVTDIATAQTAVNNIVTKLNAILTALRAAGVIAP